MKLKKKLKENWLGFILGAVLTYTVGPAIGLPVLQKALTDEVIEEAIPVGVKPATIGKSLTDSAPATIIDNERKKEIKEVENEK